VTLEDRDRGGGSGLLPGLELDRAAVPLPDPSAEPEGFVVTVDSADRIHFLDWGGPAAEGAPGIVAIHGLGQTAWAWAPVARRLRAARRFVAMDLRGHGLSDAPTHGYEPVSLAGDLIAVAEGAGLLDLAADRVVLAGHGFGACVAAWAATVLGPRCAGIVLVDGGWQDIRATSGLEPDEFLRSIEEPPEVLRSMGAFLADRAAFDPGTWDADQERAARATVVEVPAGRVLPATRPHALEGCVGAMFAYRPNEVLAAIPAPVLALAALDDEAGTMARSLAEVQRARQGAGRPAIPVARFPADGHNLMRYRPVEVAAAILQVTAVHQSSDAALGWRPGVSGQAEP
jgi:pimeloyl-ACP methyl ester carboxylesterase